MVAYMASNCKDPRLVDGLVGRSFHYYVRISTPLRTLRPAYTLVDYNRMDIENVAIMGVYPTLTGHIIPAQSPNSSRQLA